MRTLQDVELGRLRRRVRVVDEEADDHRARTRTHGRSDRPTPQGGPQENRKIHQAASVFANSTHTAVQVYIQFRVNSYHPFAQAPGLPGSGGPLLCRGACHSSPRHIYICEDLIRYKNYANTRERHNKRQESSAELAMEADVEENDAFDAMIFSCSRFDFEFRSCTIK